MYLPDLTVRFRAGFGLAFDIEKADTKSGFAPARTHLGTPGAPAMFADFRLHGFAAALRLDFIEKLYLAGKDEKRYPGEHINQAWAIREMLVHDCGIDGSRIEYRESTKNTEESLAIIQKWMKEILDHPEDPMDLDDVVVLTNFYHDIRSSLMHFKMSKMPVMFLPTEMLMLAELPAGPQREALKRRMQEEFRKGLVERITLEINGCTDILTGAYVAQTQGWKAA